MRKYSQITIFVFAALLVAFPMTTSNVFAQQSTGQAELAGSCGIIVPSTIDLGTLNAGAVGLETVVVVATTGTLISTLSVVAGDWIGLGDGQVHLNSEVTRFAITTDGTTNAEVTYVEKVSFGTVDVSTTLSNTVTPAFDTNLYLQISADGTLKNMPYSGPLEQTLTFTSSCTP